MSPHRLRSRPVAMAHGMLARPVDPARARWLLLIHQLPKEPAYLRVKVSRRLARVGAAAIKNSVYVLPATESAGEDFQWVRREIVEGRGDATVVEAQLVEGMTDDEVEGLFRDAREADYEQVASGARDVGKTHRKKTLDDESRRAMLADVMRLERRMEEIGAIDFFGALGRESAAGLVRELRRRAEAPPPVQAHTAHPPAEQPVRARTWVTRTGVHVDRIASAWLIGRFIDPEATFKMVPATGYVPQPGELRFDMSEAEYSHEGDRCTFETLMSRFELAQPGLGPLAEVIHDIDLKDDKFGRPETPGVAAAVTGIALAYKDDHSRIGQGSALFDALQAFFARSKHGR